MPGHINFLLITHFNPCTIRVATVIYSYVYLYGKIVLTIACDTTDHTHTSKIILITALSIVLGSVWLIFIDYNYIDGQPKIHELERLSFKNGDTIKIIEDIAPKWETVAFGLKLPSSRVEIIKRDYKDRCEDACHEMLQRWLDGINGTLGCTWKSMIKVLQESNYSKLAQSLKSSIM